MSEHNHRRDPESFNRIVKKCLEGDEAAWKELVTLIRPVVFGVCKAWRLTRDERVDIFATTCWLLLENLGNLRSPAALRSYVAITVQREVMRLKDRSKFLEDAIKSKQIDIHPAGADAPDKELERSQEKQIILSALMELPVEEAKLIYLLFLDEAEPSYQEISKQMGIPVSSIGPKRMRALEKLKAILRRLGYDF